METPKTYIQLHCADTVCRLDYLNRVMASRDRWWEWVMLSSCLDNEDEEVNEKIVFKSYDQINYSIKKLMVFFV